ncbi:MAG: right-handed parallel beta-helix repeat-containing protein, partial [Promethearchaeota archaeon]
MLQKPFRYLLILALLLLSPILFNGIMLENMPDSSKAVTTRFTASYEPHAPIVISSDAGFESQGWPGNGSISNPYLIENLSIVSNGKCIEVDGTTAFFTIRKCSFSSATAGNGRGIDFANVLNGEIENCTFLNLDIGFFLWRSANCSFINNSLSDCNLGTYLYKTLNSSFSENTFTSCGFYIAGDLSGHFEHDFSSNLVNDKEFGLFLNETDLAIDGSLYGQVYLVGCNNTSINSGSFDDATLGVTMFGCFNSSLVSASITQNHYGIYMSNSPNCSIIRCNITENGPWPIGIYESEGALFSKNVVFSNFAEEDWGVAQLSSENCTFISNAFYDNSDYSLVEGGHGTIIANNSFYGHPRSGVWFFFAEDLLIVNNSFYRNGYAGLELQDSENSLIYLNKFGWNLVTNVWDNDGSSPIPNDWDNGTIGNYWDDYSGTGVYEVPSASMTENPIDHFPHVLVDSTDPSLSHPSDEEIEFGSEGPTISWNAFDQFPFSYEILVNNTSVKTDYWRNGVISYETGVLEAGLHNCTLVCYDGAGNLSYDVVLVTVLDTTPPLLSPAENVSYELGSANNYVNWTASDPHPGSYGIFIDDTLESTGDWISSENVSIDLSGLDLGVHNVTAAFYDAYANSVVDTISVEVIDTTSPTISHPSDIVVQQGFVSQVVRWSVFDLQPATYEFYLNGTLVTSSIWTETELSITVNETSASIYMLELRVYDSSGNSAFDVVLLSVIPSTSTTTPTTPAQPTSPPALMVLVSIGAGAAILI